MAMDVTSPVKFTATVSALDSSGESFSLVFQPRLSKLEAMQTTVAVTHLPSRSCNCRILVIPAAAATNRIQRRRIGTSLYYLAFETHAIQLEAGAVKAMWLQLDDVQVKNPDAPPIYQPAVDWRWFFDQEFPGRYTGLPYLPPDPSLEPSQLAVLGIDPALVPQRGPLWFKLRAEITGSQVCKLLGDFVPKPGTSEAATFSPDKFETFTGWKRINVQMGKLRESVQIACILAAFPLRSFRECGSIAHPSHFTWSASPDGFIVDAEITPALVEAARAEGGIIPHQVLRDYPTVDPMRGGVVEFKASRSTFTMSGYHVAQCIWEMYCTNTLWCDLVRYTEQWERDAQGIMKPATRCKTVRIFRCKSMEDRIAKLVQASHAVKRDAAKFMHLVHTEPYVTMRAELNTLATQCSTVATEIPVPTELVARMDAHRNHLATQTVAAQVPALHPALDRIEERQSKAFSLYHGTEDERAEFVAVAAEQIEDYAQLIESVAKKQKI